METEQTDPGTPRAGARLTINVPGEVRRQAELLSFGAERKPLRLLWLDLPTTSAVRRRPDPLRTQVRNAGNVQLNTGGVIQLVDLFGNTVASYDLPTETVYPATPARWRRSGPRAAGRLVHRPADPRRGRLAAGCRGAAAGPAVAGVARLLADHRIFAADAGPWLRPAAAGAARCPRGGGRRDRRQGGSGELGRASTRRANPHPSCDRGDRAGGAGPRKDPVGAAERPRRRSRGAVER